MKRCILFILSAILILVLTGCAQLKAEYTIGSDNKVTVRYSLQIDKSKLTGKEGDLAAGIESTKKYWEEQGLTVNEAQDEKSVTLTGEKALQAQCPKEAYEKLKEILTGKYSPFNTLDFQFVESYFNNQYALSGELRLKAAIRKSGEKPMPDNMVKQLEDAAGSATYTVTVGLPGKITGGNGESTTEKDGMASGTWTVHYGQTQTLQLFTQAENIDNRQKYDALINEKNTYTLFFYIAIGAGTTILAAIAFLLIVRIRKRAVKKTSLRA